MVRRFGPLDFEIARKVGPSDIQGIENELHCLGFATPNQRGVRGADLKQREKELCWRVDNNHIYLPELILFQLKVKLFYLISTSPSYPKMMSNKGKKQRSYATQLSFIYIHIYIYILSRLQNYFEGLAFLAKKYCLPEDFQK